MNIKTLNSLIMVLSLVVVTSLVSPTKVYAGCSTNYGGYSQTCVYNKSFDIDKDVRIEGDDEWKDKVTDADEDDVIEFRIRVKNVGEVEVDNMKYNDDLPDEMEKVGGSGLTEYWNDFEPGERVEYIIKAKVRSSEYDRENFEKCVVNKVEVKYGDKHEGSDTATVCYGNATVTELPETGPTAGVTMILIGLVMLTAGMLVRKKIL